MNPDISRYIHSQPNEWQELIISIHKIITETDKSITPAMQSMMGKEMILYNAGTMMKYGLAGTSKHISLHLLPMYASPDIHARYQKLLPKAKFQKGCINFNSADQMPTAIVQKLIADCAPIDIVKQREEQLKSRKKK